MVKKADFAELHRTAAKAEMDAEHYKARLARAERALVRGGFQDLGGEEWKPPLGPVPDFILRERLAEAERCIDTSRRFMRGEVVDDQGEAWDQALRVLDGYGAAVSASVSAETEDPTKTLPCADCGESTDVWYDGSHLCWKCRA